MWLPVALDVDGSDSRSSTTVCLMMWQVTPTEAAVRVVPERREHPSLSSIPERKFKVRQIEKQIGKDFVDGVLPTPEEICKKQLLRPWTIS